MTNKIVWGSCDLRFIVSEIARAIFETIQIERMHLNEDQQNFEISAI